MAAAARPAPVACRSGGGWRGPAAPL